jgi:integrase/recombinase XerD
MPENIKNIYWRNGIAWARFKVRGKPYRFSLFTRSPAQAKKRLKAAQDEIVDAVAFGIRGVTSWPEAVVSWSESATASLSPTTLTRYIVSIGQLRDDLDQLAVQQIDAGVLRELAKRRRASGATTRTIKNDLTALSSVLEHCKEEGWIEDNPTLSFRTVRSMRDRVVPILLPTDAAIAAMLEASPPRFADAQMFARETGMRQEEIFGLQHQAIDLKSGTVTVRGKGQRIRVIPLSPLARTIAARQPRHIKGRFVFWHDSGERWTSPGSRFGDIRRRVAQKATREKWPFDPFRFHDYRHLFAVEYLRDRKGTIYDLQRLLGHESIKTTERYLDFLTPEEVLFAKHGVTQIGAQS